MPLKADCLIQCCSRDALWGPKCWEPHNLTLCLHKNCHVSVTPAGWRCPWSTAASPCALSVSVCTFEHVCRSQSAVFSFDVLMYFTISGDTCDRDVKLAWLHVSWLGGWVGGWPVAVLAADRFVFPMKAEGNAYRRRCLLGGNVQFLLQFALEFVLSSVWLPNSWSDLTHCLTFCFKGLQNFKETIYFSLPIQILVPAVHRPFQSWNSA